MAVDTPLLGDDGNPSIVEDNLQDVSTRRKGNNSPRNWQLIALACLICVACTITNLFFVRHSQSQQITSFRRLERRSTYIGLEKLSRGNTSTSLGPISNFPSLLAQIDEAQPHRVFIDSHRWFSASGVVYPEDRRFLLTPGVSTVARFRILDFGMERCTLTGAIPSLSALNEANRTISLFESPVIIQVWRLQSETDLDPHTLSWASRPRRESLLTSWSISPGDHPETYSFPCLSGSLHVFEFACAGASCHLDFQQSNKEPDFAFFLVQQQSF